MTDLCQHLAESFDVHVVCGQPNSPTDDRYLREGIEVQAGVTIHRLQHRQFAKRVPAGRLFNLVSFTRAASRYLRHTQLQSDIVVSETDPFLLPIVAANYARRSDAKLVCYLQDIYPDVAEAIGKVKPGLLTCQIRGRLDSAYQAADRVVVLGNCMRRRLQSSPWSVDPEKMRVLPNWADCQLIQPKPIEQNQFRNRQGLQDRFVVMHSGNMGLTQRLDVLLDATRSAAWPEGAVLLLVGDGAARTSLQQQAARCQTDRVRFLSYQPREALAESLSTADLHVVSMHEGVSGCLCPSKLYGILAAGRPVLAIANETTDLCQTVTDHQLGWSCQPGDSGRIAQLVNQASSDNESRIAAGQRARKVACEYFDRQIVTQQFAEMLGELLPRDGRSSLRENCGEFVPNAIC